MIGASICLVACMCVLDSRRGDASWSGVRLLRRDGRSSSETRPLRLLPRLMRDRQQPQRSRPRRGTTAMAASSGNQLSTGIPSCHRKRASMMRCEGEMHRGGWRQVMFVVSRPPAASSRGYTWSYSQDTSSSPWRQQRQRQQPSAELLRNAWKCGPCAAKPRRSECVRQQCRPGVSMTSREEDGENVALPIPPPRMRQQQHEQQQQQQQQPDEDPDVPYVRPEVPRWRHKAVIIPGFATDARAFEQLCHRLERRGIASVVVPIRWYHWLPTLGGRSVRPILDRIHETVIRCVMADEHKDLPYAFNEPGLQKEVSPYTAQDFLAEMDDPTRGAHHMGPLNLPVLPATPSTGERVILVAHSAGGWISRIYLSEARYDGRTYNASCLVNGLVTLGTPHVRLEDDFGRPRELPFSRNFKFVEEFCVGEVGGDWEKRTPTACIGGAALQGQSIFRGLYKDLVYQSYELCCGDGSGMGDGITPLTSAFGMAGAQRYVELEGVLHAAGLGGPWYGSESVIDSWLGPSLDTFFGPATTADGGASSVSRAGSKPRQQAASSTARDDDRMGKDVA
ncbi:unnamed protein product [Pylaiella littoralis]